MLIWRDSFAIFGALMSLASAGTAKDMLAFGGPGHDVFLGCLTCPGTSADSICNRFGFGSAFRAESIFNGFGKFGSQFSASSPWNEFANVDNVPVVVDRQGNFYGYLTINQFALKASYMTGPLLDMFKTANGDLAVVQNMICGAP